MILGDPLDFNKLEARNLRMHVLGSAPGSPVTGQMYYDSGTNIVYFWDGTTWQSTKSGASGAAGGDLSGTYPNPQIATGVIVDADVNASAAIAESKLSLATDAAAGTGSRRTLGSGSLQAMPGNRTLDAISAPVASLSMNSQRITGLADPSGAQDAATKAYVDATAVGLDVKPSVRAATTANIASLAGGAPNTLDGVTLAASDRILVKDQTTGSQNGIYTVTTLGTGSNGTWARSADADTSAEVTAGLFTFVEEGTTNADSGWVLTTDNPITLATTALTFTQFSGAGQITAGAALTKTGNTLDVAVDNSSIEVNADALRVKALGITNAMLAGSIDLTAKVTGALPIGNGGTGQTTAKTARETGLTAAGYYSSATHGAGTTITITQATHGLRSSRGLHVSVQDEATGNMEIVDWSVASNGDVTVTYAVSQSANSKRVTIIG